MEDEDDDSASARAAFWHEQDAQPFWTVPIAHGGEMPWLKLHERGLLVAIQRAHELGRTVLLIDTSDDSVVDTYYTYEAALFLEAKRLVLDVARGTASVDEVLETCRVQVANAMRFGQTLYVRLTDCACDFLGTYNADDKFPLAIFDRSVVASLEEYKEGTANNLWKAGHPMSALLREDDLAQGIFQPRFSHKATQDGHVVGFEVILCTKFSTDDFRSFLGDSLPLHLLQPIKLLPSSVRLKYSHYDRVLELEPGGSLRWERLDDELCLSFVFKGSFGVALYAEAKAAPTCQSGAADGRGRGRGRGRGAAPPAAPQPSGEGIRQDRSGRFHGLKGGTCYLVVVEEDEAAEAEARASAASGATPARLSAAALSATAAAASKLTRKPAAAGLPGRSDDGSTRTAAFLASELRSLSTADVEERSERYRALREAADLQDVVFGG